MATGLINGDVLKTRRVDIQRAIGPTLSSSASRCAFGATARRDRDNEIFDRAANGVRTVAGPLMEAPRPHAPTTRRLVRIRVIMATRTANLAFAEAEITDPTEDLAVVRSGKLAFRVSAVSTYRTERLSAGQSDDGIWDRFISTGGGTPRLFETAPPVLGS